MKALKLKAFDMDAYERFVEAEKRRAMSKAGRGRLAPDLEELIGRAMEYAEKEDKVKLLRKQVIEIAVRGYWGERLNQGRKGNED